MPMFNMRFRKGIRVLCNIPEDSFTDRGFPKPTHTKWFPGYITYFDYSKESYGFNFQNIIVVYIEQLDEYLKFDFYNRNNLILDPEYNKWVLYNWTKPCNQICSANNYLWTDKLFNIGTKLDCTDCEGLWYNAVVVESLIVMNSVKISYIGFSDRWDEWIHIANFIRIAPYKTKNPQNVKGVLNYEFLNIYPNLCKVTTTKYNKVQK